MSGTRRPVVLLTGASGEIGHSLITKLAEDGSRPILTLDLKPLPRDLARLVEREYIGSILERNLLERILSEFEIDLVFHLAALLSTRGEFTSSRRTGEREGIPTSGVRSERTQPPGAR
jgi:nucleoside-diphosphate-sugar epimerase